MEELQAEEPSGGNVDFVGGILRASGTWEASGKHPTFGNHCDTNQTAFKTTNSLSFYRFLLTCDDCGIPFLYHWAHFWCPGDAFGTTMGHQKEPLEPPWRTFTARHQKQPKRQLFGDLFWSSDLTTFLVFSCPCFYMSCRHGK